MPVECLRCAQIEGRQPTPGGVIYDDGLWHVTQHPSEYTDPGELILATRRHCESLAQLTREEAAALGPLLRAAVAVVEEVVRPERVYVAAHGERVRHVHFFLLPRTRDLPAGHVRSDLFRNGRNQLRRLGLASNPSAGDRAAAAARMRELWPRAVAGLCLVLGLHTGAAAAQGPDGCPRGRADEKATMISGAVHAPHRVLAAAIDSALVSLGYHLNAQQSTPDQWVTEPRFAWPGGAPPEGWSGGDNPGVEVVVDLSGQGDSTRLSIAANTVCAVAAAAGTKPGETESSLEATAALEVAQGVGQRLTRPGDGS